MPEPLELLRVDPELLGVLSSEGTLSDRYEVHLVDTRVDYLGELLKQSLEFYDRIGAVDPWIGYLSIDPARRQVVGCCGFKGNPVDGMVEIAYHTFPEYEGQGLATRAAAAMVVCATGQPGVDRILAHTLPERNASCRVLEKSGFESLGEVIDPEDGPVWRWQRTP